MQTKNVSVINPAAITTGDVQDVNADLTKFQAAKLVVQATVLVLKDLVDINSKEDQELALKAVSDAAKVSKAIEAKRKELVKPFNDAVKQINQHAGELTEELDVLIEKVKQSILAYQKQEEKRFKMARATQRQATLVAMGFTFDANLSTYTLTGIGMATSLMLEEYDDNAWANLINTFHLGLQRRADEEKKKLQEEKDLADMFGSDEDKADISAKLAQTEVAPPPVYVPPVNGHKVDAVKGTTKRWTFDITDINAVPREYMQVNETAIRNAIRDGVRQIPGVNIYQSESLTIR